MVDASELVDLEAGLISPSVLADPEIHRAEQSRVFGRSWLFVAHESQVASPGDFFSSFMGTERVIVVRDAKGELQVLVDSCRHRGSRVCLEDFGNKKAFTCPYHQWTYDLSGKLTGVPHRDRAYGRRLEENDLSLVRAARVETYRGLVFATFAPTGPTLNEFLGDAAWYLDILLDQTEHGMIALQGVQKWRAGTNWKLAAEQFAGDTAHPGGVHASLQELGYDVGFGDGAKGDFVVELPNGHGWIHLAPRAHPLLSSFERGVLQEAQARLTEDQAGLLGGLDIATIFPNLSLVSYPGFVTFRLWLPKGPREMEIWSWCLTHGHAPPETRDKAQKMLTNLFSASGMFEQDDVEVWEGCSETLGGEQRGRHAMVYMQLESPEISDSPFPGKVYAPPSDRPLLGFYSTWSECMDGGNDRR